MKSVTFHINRSDIDPALGNNAQSLSDINNFIEAANADSCIKVTEVMFCGYASPDGSLEFNKKLAKRRMETIEKLTIGGGKISNLKKISHKSDVISISILKELIDASNIPHRREALDILDDTPSSHHNHDIIKKLQQGANGSVWKEIRPLLGQLRYASVTFTYTTTTPPPSHTTSPPDTISITEPEETFTKSPDTIAIAEAGKTNTPITLHKKRPLYISLKTNMLYDAMLIPSIGAEAYVGKMTSINANWSYAWWKNDRRHNYWRYYGGDISFRRWFGKLAASKPLTGHHLGLYAQILTYDFELGGKGQMGNKYNYGGGLEYGFSLPVKTRLNIDFTLGIGYLGGKYHEYTPIDGHYVWQATKRRNWFGPTKAEISLVWLIGHGNRNTKKGGKR